MIFQIRRKTTFLKKLTKRKRGKKREKEESKTGPKSIKREIIKEL